jgi:protein FAM50
MTAEQLKAPPEIHDADLEGFNDDAALTKVIDRRWYEKNKHIYPMSVWEEYDAERDYTQGGRKDKEGNAFFYSSR